MLGTGDLAMFVCLWVLALGLSLDIYGAVFYDFFIFVYWLTLLRDSIFYILCYLSES